MFYLVRNVRDGKWLLTDNVCTKVRWVGDRALASRHSLEWVERFCINHSGVGNPLKFFSEEEALEKAARGREEALHSDYANAIETVLNLLAPGQDFLDGRTKDYLWKYKVAEGLARGVTAEKVAKEFLREQGTRNQPLAATRGGVRSDRLHS